VNGDDFTLMMLYANGFGVKRNYNLAINYACIQRYPESGFAVDVMIEELLRRNKSGSEEQLDLCDFAGTTFAISYCISMKEGQKEKARIRRLGEIRISMDGRQKAFFDKLREAAQDFASSSSRNEVDQLGSGRAGFVIDAEAELKESFLDDIEKCEQGVFPEYTLVQFTAFDKQLNKTYQAIMHTQTEAGSDRLFSTDITKSGIKEAQRTWLKFRDAWVKYGEARYPNVPTHTWKAMLTERRVKKLEGLLNSDPP